MTTRDDIDWFKQQFRSEIEQAIAGTPYDLAMITAIACQETGYIWQRLRKNNMPLARILELCVGDTIDHRKAFPRSRAELEAAPRGKDMFSIARAALVDMAQHIPGYAATAKNPDKFCHGFGIFQYDIQAFITGNDDYFINKEYVDFDKSLAKCIEELESAQQRIRLNGRDTLTDMEKAAIAIAYNTGSYDPSLGLKQGFYDGSKYYGQYFWDYMMLARGSSGPSPSMAAVAPSGVPSAASYRIISTTPLNLRATSDPDSAIIGRYPSGTQVSVLSQTGNWSLVSLNSTDKADGYMWSDYLRPV